MKAFAYMRRYTGSYLVLTLVSHDLFLIKLSSGIFTESFILDKISYNRWLDSERESDISLTFALCYHH